MMDRNVGHDETFFIMLIFFVAQTKWLLSEDIKEEIYMTGYVAKKIERTFL